MRYRAGAGPARRPRVRGRLLRRRQRRAGDRGADALSRGELDGSEARLGQAQPDRLSFLQHEALIPVPGLLTASYDSRLYRGDPRTELLYAESEALVRWIVARHGLAALQSLLAAIAEGAPPLPAFAERVPSRELGQDGTLLTLDALADPGPGH